MTVSANATPDFQRDQIIAAAYGICGIIPMGAAPDADQVARAAVHFSMALLDLQSEGIVLTTAIRSTIAILAGTAEYPLESDTIDVRVDTDDTVGTMIPSATGAAETIVRSMSWNEYLKIATKSTQSGQPSRCFIDKSGAAIKLVFWPIPNYSSSAGFRYTKVRLLRDNDTGSSTLELRRTWAPYMMYATAVGCARDSSKFELARDFKQEAAEKLAKCKAGDSARGAIRFRAGHSGRNW